FIVPGDREEAISAGVVCTYLGIPLMHFFGGDFSTSGHIDNPIRAATSKLASIHMVNIEEHKKRLISFGETEKSIFVVGSPSLDKFKEESKMPKKAVLQKVKATYFNDYAILIYHPPLGKDNGRIGNSSEIKNILKVLDRQKINTFVSYPNTDFGNTEIIKAFESYRGNKNFYFYKNFDRNTFVNIYRNASFQIGNSSAGIYEAPAIPIPVIDIGNRQRARGGSENLIRVKGEIKDIETAIKKVKSDSFKKKIKNMASLFGDGKSSKRAYKIIKGIRNYKDFLLKTNDTI
ncbi:MAG: UDP-N-acetylglucosamine 2-epimerase, partial [Clostridiales Family XIII bacterium]|nr:UDP-N-acetylglucosamine 2-epimerase [Clostridiales Family XIII bacterium]